MTGPDRESTTTDALLTDLYLDALLAGAVLESVAVGAPGIDPTRIDPAARRAADRLRRDLVRVHPSFRFEERLATRLAEAAVAMRLPLAAGAEGGRVVGFRPGPPAATDPANESQDDRPADGPGGSSSSPPTDAQTVGAAGFRRSGPRPLIIGGALTSAALSIAGAAFVAWRLGRPSRPATPMARAARAIRAGSTARHPLRAPGRRSASRSGGGFD
jgi:hypothetical protein